MLLDTSIYSLLVFAILCAYALFLKKTSLLLVPPSDEDRWSLAPLYITCFVMLAAASLLPLMFYPYTPIHVVYFLFISTLIITIDTDIRQMLISRFMTLYLIPFGYGASFLHNASISPTESIIGCISAFVFLYGISWFYRVYKKIDGMGWGDIELLMYIGSLLGVFGWWFSLMCGAYCGACIGLCIAWYWKKPLRSTKIPFGPFLSFGAMVYVYAKLIR